MRVKRGRDAEVAFSNFRPKENGLTRGGVTRFFGSVDRLHDDDLIVSIRFLHSPLLPNRPASSHTPKKKKSLVKCETDGQQKEKWSRLVCKSSECKSRLLPFYIPSINWLKFDFNFNAVAPISNKNWGRTATLTKRIRKAFFCRVNVKIPGPPCGTSVSGISGESFKCRPYWAPWLLSFFSLSLSTLFC